MQKKRKKNWLKARYIDALKFYDIQVSPKTSIKKMQSLWKSAREEAKSAGLDTPTLYQAYKEVQHDYEETPRDENMRTDTPTDKIDVYGAVIDRFLENVRRVYNDTINFIDRYSDNSGSQEDNRLAQIARQSENLDGLRDRYESIVQTITQMVADYGAQNVANAIAGNVELDYVIAVRYMPPSDIEFAFDETLEWLLAIETQIIDDARERAETNLE